MRPPKITKENVIELFDTLYDASLNGVPGVSRSIPEMAHDYGKRHKSNKAAIKEMHRFQIAKCTTSGFLTNLGGAVTLPVAIPINIGNVLYVQMRMIACTAYMAGYDLKSDQVQTLVYACLAGVSTNQLVKTFGIKLSTKITTNTIKKIPMEMLIKINRFIGFRFVTKFGEKGLINLGKMVPAVGGVIGGGMDYIETTAIADRAYKMFVK